MDSQASEQTQDGAQEPIPAGIVVSVCITCKSPNAGLTGPGLLDMTRAALGDGRDVTVRAVQCLGVCKRPGTVAVSAPDGYTFVFGDLQPETGSEALAAFVRSYPRAKFGLVPWRERAEVLRRGLVARIPPAAWSPEDGRPPS